MSEHQNYNSVSVLSLVRCSFEKCSSSIGGGFICVNSGCLMSLEECMFIRCFSTSKSINGFREDIGSGSFAAVVKSSILKKICFLESHGPGNGFVYHSISSEENSNNQSTVFLCGTVLSGSHGCLVDYGNQHFCYNNGSSNYGVIGSFATPGSRSSFAHYSFATIYNNSNSQSCFGLGTYYSSSAYAGYFNIVNNFPSKSIFNTWGSYTLFSSYFKNSTPNINEQMSGSMTLNSCYSDTTFKSASITQCYSNIVQMTTYNIEIFDHCKATFITYGILKRRFIPILLLSHVLAY